MTDPDRMPDDTVSATSDSPAARDAGARGRLGEPSGATRTDLMKTARGLNKPVLPKRFYERAGVDKADGGYRLVLDGRPARTPARRPLALPNRVLADRLAAEWQAQAETIDPARMPLTRLVNSAIDGVAERRAAVVEDLCAYAGTDLVAYRAGDPPRLVEAQGAAWDPVVEWARDALGVRLVLSEGVMHVTQAPETVARLRAAIEAVSDPFRLAALHAMTTLTGSLLIALAVLHGRLTPSQAWDAAHVDESYQSGVWGADAEAAARLSARRAEFEAAADLARLSG